MAAGVEMGLGVGWEGFEDDCKSNGGLLGTLHSQIEGDVENHHEVEKR
jgi:hypothetical protein